MPKTTSERGREHPQTKGRSMGGPVHSRSRSGNWQGHHQKRPRQDAGGSQRKTEESHRGKRGHRLRTGQDLHRGELAGGLDGELRENQTADRPPSKPSQGFLKNHIKPQIGSIPLADLDFSGLTAVLQAPAGRRAGRPHRGQEEAERSGTENRAQHPPDDRLGVQSRHGAAAWSRKIQRRAAPCRKSNTRR